MSQKYVDRYKLIEEIGRGGMAVVHRAFDPRFKRDVAIKIMGGELLQDKTLRARFEREAQTIAALEHPSIVPVYDFGGDDSRLFLVMRLMTGGTLTERLNQGPLTISQTSQILNRIGSALDRAHQKGIIHRDLKPSNIMFDEYGDAFLADFGIARLTESSVTLTGQSVIGTPAYMSPEQIHGDKSIDGRSDIYALGVICFEMLTGDRPYRADSPARVMMKHIMDPVPDIRQAKPDLPAGVGEIIARTMAKKPEERYSSAGELTDTLSSIAQIETLRSKPSKTIPMVEPEPGVTEVSTSPTAPVVVPTETVLEPAQVAIKPQTVEETPLDVADDATVLEAPAVEEPHPETEVAYPVFATREEPDTEVMAPTFPVPPKKTGRRPLVFGIAAVALIAILAVVLVVTGVFSGGVDEESDRSEAPVVAEETAIEAAETPVEETAPPTEVRPTSTPRPTPTTDPRPMAEAHLEKVYSLMEDENPEGALQEINQAIELEPDNNWYFHERSWIYWTMEDFDRALNSINQAVHLAPGDAGNYTRRAQIYRDTGDDHLALEDHETAIRIEPGSGYHRHEYAITLRNINEFEAAIEQFNIAIELEPNQVWHIRQRAHTLMEMGDLEAAQSDWQYVIRRDPDDADAHANLAYTYREMGNLEAALEVLNTAIDIDPTVGWFFGQRSEIFLSSGDIDAAISDAERSIELDPENPGHVHQLASLYFWELKDWDRGIQYMNQVIDMAPDEAWRYRDRANMYWQMGNKGAALTDLERAIDIEPDDIWTYIDLGYFYWDEVEDPEAAFEAWNRAAEVDPEYPDVYHARHLYHRFHTYDYQAAYDDLSKCVELEPEKYWCYWERAWMQNEYGQTSGAVADFRRFLESIPDWDCPECAEEAAVYIQEHG